jgi:hypothetical protein
MVSRTEFHRGTVAHDGPLGHDPAGQGLEPVPVDEQVAVAIDTDKGMSPRAMTRRSRSDRPEAASASTWWG